VRRLVALTWLLATAAAAHAETPLPAPPARFVTDHAGFLSPAVAEQLDARLDTYAQQTGHQLLVYIDHTTGGAPLEDWTVRAFERWKVGRRGVDDGLVLFVLADDHRLRLEVGYGLEARVPDAVAAQIIGQQIEPRIRAGDRDGAIRAGVEALITAVGTAPASPDHAVKPARPPVWTMVAGGIFGVFFLILLITHPSLAWLMLLSIGSGRGGGWGGGGGGGGGFSGGGGRSGGGGASGSW
jgi:uncharacterized protein